MPCPEVEPSPVEYLTLEKHMIRIVGWLPERSYGPEVYALSDYLNSLPDVAFTIAEPATAEEHLEYSDFDLAYIKMGFAPIWKKSPVPEIHDYSSAAGGTTATLKHLIKKHCSRKPILRSFLSPYVESRFGFSDGIPRIYRDMGIPDTFYSPARDLRVRREYDLFYAGSINATRQTGDMLNAIVKSARSILIAGKPSNEIYQMYKESPYVEFTGTVKHHHIPELASKCYAGINFTPDRAPFNLQTSTKVLEYLGMGMPVVSNDYEWVRRFERESGARLLKFKQLEHVVSNLYNFDFIIPDMSAYRWSKVFNASGIYSAILECIKNER